MLTAEREAWLAGRRKGVGSSDIAAICGLSPFAGPLEVYLDKLGLLPPRESPEMSWGTMLEEVIAQAYTEETGETLARGVQMGNYSEPWMLANPDWISQRGIVETKNTRDSRGWGVPGTDEVPPAYLCQVQWQFAVMGLQTADVAVLIAGSDFRIYTVPRSDEIIAELTRRGREFWDRVQRRDPPPIEPDHADAAKLLDLLRPPKPGASVELDPEAALLVEGYRQLSEDIAYAEKRRKEIRAALTARMGDAEEARVSGWKVTRKVVRRKGHVVAPSEYVDFRISQPKEEAI